MKITFISNYINHHQIPFSRVLYEKLGTDFAFIQTRPMEKERVAMGWDEEGVKLPFVHCLYENEEKGIALLMECDVLLAGWSEREDLIKKRLSAGGITIRVSERLYREGQWKFISPRGLIAKYKEHIRYRKKEVYLLCAGAYTASDFHLIGAYPDKMFQWGYFPETVFYSPEQRESMKAADGKTHIVWAGRLIPLKHPEYALKLAGDLKDMGERFHLHMVGDGEMMGRLKEMVKERNLTAAEVTFYGFCSPEQVRKVMEQSHLHLFTSNHLEGWGAVVNEAMNSACCVVSNVQVGAAPFLIEHGKNGMVYKNGSYVHMREAVMYLLTHEDVRREMGEKAYETITKLWNAEHAGEEFLRFSNDLVRGRVIPASAGPLSAAPAISPGSMYRKMRQGGNV